MQLAQMEVTKNRIYLLVVAIFRAAAAMFAPCKRQTEYGFAHFAHFFPSISGFDVQATSHFSLVQ